MGNVFVVGMGPGPGRKNGKGAWLIPEADDTIDAADVLVGAPRHIDPFTGSGKELFLLQGNYGEALEFIDDARREKIVCVLVSGDPCLFSFLKVLKRRLAANELTIIPGISSFQLLAARTGFVWNDAKVVSAHGKDPGAVADAWEHNPTLVVFTDKQNTPGMICRLMISRGCGSGKVVLGINLGYPDEKVETISLEKCAEKWMECNDLCVMILDRTTEDSTG
jgi:precorrin-6y C5,15-methyltransferase (decarboxylating) CbiE subunit